MCIDMSLEGKPLPQTVKTVTSTEDRYPLRTPRLGRVIVSAGLLTCGSGRKEGLPGICPSGMFHLRSPLTVAGAVEGLGKARTSFPFHRVLARTEIAAVTTDSGMSTQVPMGRRWRHLFPSPGRYRTKRSMRVAPPSDRKSNQILLDRVIRAC